MCCRNVEKPASLSFSNMFFIWQAAKLQRHLPPPTESAVVGETVTRTPGHPDYVCWGASRTNRAVSRGLVVARLREARLLNGSENGWEMGPGLGWGGEVGLEIKCHTGFWGCLFAFFLLPRIRRNL